MTGTPIPAITRTHSETTALRYVFDASLDLAKHVSAAAPPPAAVSGPIPALITHYGESYNGQVLGCGYGVYDSANPTIVAVGPARYGEIPCGALLEVCGPGDCIVGMRQDACPGCSPAVFDLSEAGFARVCGVPTGVCNATIHVLTACKTVDLAWQERTPRLQGDPALASHAPGDPSAIDVREPACTLG